jgi:hypothetical protein
MIKNLTILDRFSNHSLKYVGYKDRKQVASSLKQIYQSISEDEALLALDEFEHRWVFRLNDGNVKRSTLDRIDSIVFGCFLWLLHFLPQLNLITLI